MRISPQLIQRKRVNEAERKFPIGNASFGIHLGLIACLLFIASSLWAATDQAATAQPEPTPVFGDALVTAALGDARTLIPVLASDSSSAEICSLLFNGLVKYDKDINLVGDLAESWDIEEGGLRIIFHLRKGVLWHDGREFTAEDVKFTFDRLVDPQTPTPYSGDFHKIRSLRVIDRYTVKVTYQEPFSPGLASWGMSMMPKHILASQDLNTSDFSKRPVGTGPYRLKSWIRQQKIELVANQNYFEGHPYLSRYISRVIPDQTTVFLELQTGNLDVASLTPLQYTRQTQTSFFDSHYRKFEIQGFNYVYLAYNLQDPRFADIKVRQAFDHAVDKQELIRIVLLGHGRACTGPFARDSWAYNQQVSESSFDPELSRKLLNDAGWKDTDQDGWLEKNGRIFEFTILTNQGNEVRMKCAEIIQKQLAFIGVRVKIKVVEWNALLSEFIDKQKFETILLGWNLGRDPDCYDIWHSSKTRPGEFNFIHYKNEQVDRLLDQARRTFDRKERQTCYHQIHRLIHSDQPYMFLFTPDSLEIISSRIQGITPAPLGIGYNLIRWWVPQNKQRYKTYLQP